MRSHVALVGAVLLAATALGFACTSANDLEAIAEDRALPPTGGMVAPTPSGPRGMFDSPCPGYEPPVVGSNCTTNSFVPSKGECEYGHDIGSGCNDVFYCSNGAWLLLAKSMLSCPNGALCPPSSEGIVPGVPCTPSPKLVGCSYLEGTCACVPDARDAGPEADGGDDAGDDDGGESDAAAPRGRWRCAPPPEGNCPKQRPFEGTDCVVAMECDYGSCALGQDLGYVCNRSGTSSSSGFGVDVGVWVKAETRKSCF